MRIDGAAVDTGLSIDVTIDPALQALAQKTAACYTGRHDVCRALGMRVFGFDRRYQHDHDSIRIVTGSPRPPRT